MSRNYPQCVVDAICAILDRHADKGGMVNTIKAWRDLLNLPLEVADVEEIIRRLHARGYLTQMGEWIFLARPVRCPGCNRVVEQRFSVHMHEDHPRPLSAIVQVEWVD
jgi:hypothetical protein